jgi:hypothetical protein
VTAPLLKYPAFETKIKNEGGKPFIFDFARRKWLVLTPEEWVRQHFVNYLVTEKKVPLSLISIEKEVKLNGMRKRYDVVVYDRSMKPWLVAECKAPYIAVDGVVAEQALRYNLTLNAEYLLVTNGIREIVFDKRSLVVEFPVTPVQPGANYTAG